MSLPAFLTPRYRGLLWALTQRDLKARYRGSLLGFLWSLVNPLLLLGVYSFVFGYVFDSRVPGMDPYSLFLISGLFPWIWVSTAILEGTLALTTHAALIRKAAFPASLLPAVSVVSNLLHFALALPILGLALVAGRFLGYDVSGWQVVLLPLVVAVQVPMVTGLALGLAALHAHFKDVRDLVQHALTLLFFMTPILYSLDAIGHRLVRAAVWVNPFTPFTLAYQDVLFVGRVPSAGHWLVMVAVSAAFWFAGSWVFGRLSETLVEAV